MVPVVGSIWRLTATIAPRWGYTLPSASTISTPEASGWASSCSELMLRPREIVALEVSEPIGIVNEVDFADREVDANRIELRHRRQQRGAILADEVADANLRETCGCHRSATGSSPQPRLSAASWTSALVPRESARRRRRRPQPHCRRLAASSCPLGTGPFHARDRSCSCPGRPSPATGSLPPSSWQLDTRSDRS